jgi:hypothetical protein
VFGDQAIRRLAQTAKDDLDARVQALMADELLRYHRILDGLGVDAERAQQLRTAAAAVQTARAEGLGEVAETALEAADERPALEPPTVRQIPMLEAGPDEDVVEAELVDSPREERR